jgi:uncharacterized protein
MTSRPYLPAELARFEPSPLEAGFFAAAATGGLAIQQCARCRQLQHPPRELCTHCHADELGWAALSGRGRVFTYTIVHHPIGPLRAHVPYNVVSVALDEDPEIRVVSNVVDVAPDDIRVGLRVVVSWEPVRGDLSVPRFRHASEES